jgi:hypothetical protein
MIISNRKLHPSEIGIEAFFLTVEEPAAHSIFKDSGDTIFI